MIVLLNSIHNADATPDEANLRLPRNNAVVIANAVKQSRLPRQASGLPRNDELGWLWGFLRLRCFRGGDGIVLKI